MSKGAMKMLLVVATVLLCGTAQAQGTHNRVEVGNGTTAENIVADAIGDCPQATGLTVSEVAGTSARLTWSHVRGATFGSPASYTLAVYDDADSLAASHTCTDTVFVLTGLTPATQYRVFVYSNCSSGSNYDSDSADFATTCLGGGTIDIIGTNSSDQYTLPVNNYYKYSYSQQLVEASELNGPTTLLGIRYQYAGTSPMTQKNNCTIYLAHTAATDLNSWDTMAGAQTVYTGSLNCTPGWNEFTFSTPFAYNGTDNLVIAVDDNSNGYDNSSCKFALHSASYKARYYAHDNHNFDPANDLNNSSYAGYSSTWRNNMVLITPCDTGTYCVGPSVHIDSITANSIHLSWTPGYLESAWNADYRLAGTATWTHFADSTTATTASITGLDAAATYEVRITSLCGSDTAATLLTATTPCGAIMPPFSEDFEGWPTGMDSPLGGQCWNRLSNYSSAYGGNYPYTSDSYGASGNNSMYLYSNTQYYSALILPQMAPDANRLQISFNMRSSNTTYAVQVGVMTDPSDINTFVPIDTLRVNSANTWEPKLVQLTAYADTGHYVALVNSRMGISSYCAYYIDDIEVTLLPSCPSPTNFAVATSTASSANLTWSSLASTFEVEYGAPGHTPGTGTSITVSGTSATVTGLTPMATYDFYVRALCSPDDTSAWEGLPGITAGAWVMHPNQTDTLHLCGGIIYDNGGPNGPYSASQNSYIVLLPDSAGTAVSVSGQSYTESTYDNLRIYEGIGISGTELWSDYGIDTSTVFGPVTSGDPNGALTIYFHSDASENRDGFEINVLCVDSHCPHPADVAVSGETYDSITLTWNGTAASYEVEYGPRGFAHGTGTSVFCTSTSYTATGLNASSSYNFYVRAICSPGDTSLWTDTLIGNTLCGFTPLPYSEGFEYLSATEFYEAGILPNCWEAYTNGNSISYMPHVVSAGIYAYVHNGNNSLAMTSGSALFGDVKIVRLPRFGDSISNLAVKFWMGTESTSNGTLMVGVLTGEGWEEDFVGLDTIPATSLTQHSNGGFTDSVSLANAPANAQYIAFMWRENGSFHTCCLDDIEVVSTITCPQPDVVLVNVALNDATISWNGTGNDYEVACKEAIAPDWPTPTAVTGNTYTFIGLAPNTDYEFRVRQNCGNANYSIWAQGTFTTGICDPVTQVQVQITGDGTSATIDWTPGANNGDLWEINYGEPNFQQGSGNLVLADHHPYTLTGLGFGEHYDLYVRAVCGDELTSIWSERTTFETLPNDGIVHTDGLGISIYPNPANGTTTIVLNGINGKVTIAVVDMNGRTVASSEMECDSTCTQKLDVAPLSQGAYFVRIYGEEVNVVRKLIIR